MNVAAFTLCGSETPVLQPGFRLHHANGADMWLPSCAASEAAESVEIAWKAAEMQALTWFERNQTLEGHLQVLRTETSADHHQHLQMGIVEAMLGKRDNAIGYLITACGLYAKDGRAWCPAYIDRAKALIDALARGEEGELLEQWRVANLAVHRIKSS